MVSGRSFACGVECVADELSLGRVLKLTALTFAGIMLSPRLSTWL